MLPIHKNFVNPLQDVCRIPDMTYGDNRIPKEALKLSLLQEQGYLCAYCMCRITENNMSVEHWKPRHPKPIDREFTEEEKEQNRLLSINYKNMLAVCSGNEGNRPKNQHCDTRKGNASIEYNPANSAHHLLLKIKYTETTGKILSENENFNIQLSDVLNINIEFIKSNRLSVLRNVKSSLGKCKGTATRAQIQSLLTHWTGKNVHGEYLPFSGIAIWYLTKRL